jgi:hypothetical protein
MALPLAAILAATQGTIGLSQMIGGFLTKTPDRPEYAPPQALSEMVNTANREANASMMPGQAQMQQRIQAATSNMVNSAQQNATSSSQLLNSAAAAQVAENRSLTDLYLQSLSFKDRAMMRRQQALLGMAQAEDRAWDYNKNQVFQDKMSTKAGLLGAGLQTTTNAISGLGAAMAANQNNASPKIPVNLPAAPQAQGYSLNGLANLNQEDSWRVLQERMRAGLNSMNGY